MVWVSAAKGVGIERLGDLMRAWLAEPPRNLYVDDDWD